MPVELPANHGLLVLFWVGHRCRDSLGKIGRCKVLVEYTQLSKLIQLWQLEGTRSKGLSEEMISPPPPPPPAPNYPESPEPEFPAPPAPPAPPKDAKLPPPPPPPPAPRHPEPPRPPKDMAPPAPNFPPPPPPPPAPNVDELIQNANTVYWNGKKISKKKLQKKLDKKDTKSMTINVHDDKLYLYDN